MPGVNPMNKGMWTWVAAWLWLGGNIDGLQMTSHRKGSRKQTFQMSCKRQSIEFIDRSKSVHKKILQGWKSIIPRDDFIEKAIINWRSHQSKDSSSCKTSKYDLRLVLFNFSFNHLIWLWLVRRSLFFESSTSGFFLLDSEFWRFLLKLIHTLTFPMFWAGRNRFASWWCNVWVCVWWSCIVLAVINEMFSL